MYGRLFIPELCQGFKQAIYLDVDISVNLDIAELARIDLQDSYIAAVPEFGIEIIRKTKAENLYIRDNLGLNANNYYINSGVLVFNIPKWQELNLTNQCLAKLAICTRSPDQDAINMVCKDHIYYLEQKYNFISWDYREMLKNEDIQQKITQSDFLKNLVNEYNKWYYSDKNIIHYIGYIKPWHQTYDNHANLWWQHCMKTDVYHQILLNKPVIKEQKISIIYLLGIPLFNTKSDHESLEVFLGKMPILKIKQGTKSHKKIINILGLRFITIRIKKVD